MVGLNQLFLNFSITFAILFNYSYCDECPKGWQFSAVSSECYFLSEKLYTFDEFIPFCQSIGGSAVTITSYNEKDALADLTNTTLLQPWIGSRRNTTTGSFYNVDKSYFYIYMWADNEPSVNGDCVTFKGVSSKPGLVVSQCDQLQPAFCKQTPALCNSGTFGGAYTRNGTFTSPGYPVQYYNNLNCAYLINSPNGTYITINFDPFLIESYMDYVSIYDGNSTSYANYIGDVSTYYKRTYESSSNQMLVVFKTNYAITNKGWLATWSAKKKSTPVYQYGSNGTMTSPNYPNDYDSYTEQYYYINAAYGMQLNITIDDFLTENRFDYLNVYNSSYKSTSNLIATLSGSSVAPWNFVTPGSSAALAFYTDGSVQKKGWHLTWTIC